MRLARDGLERCPHCAALRSELWEMEVPALRTRAVNAGVDHALIAETHARRSSDAKKELVSLIVRQASARSVQLQRLHLSPPCVGGPTLPRRTCAGQSVGRAGTVPQAGQPGTAAGLCARA